MRSISSIKYISYLHICHIRALCCPLECRHAAACLCSCTAAAGVFAQNVRVHACCIIYPLYKCVSAHQLVYKGMCRLAKEGGKRGGSLSCAQQVSTHLRTGVWVRLAVCVWLEVCVGGSQQAAACEEVWGKCGNKCCLPWATLGWQTLDSRVDLRLWAVINPLWAGTDIFGTYFLFKNSPLLYQQLVICFVCSFSVS